MVDRLLFLPAAGWGLVEMVGGALLQTDRGEMVEIADCELLQTDRGVVVI